jgi:hypothetical protein
MRRLHGCGRDLRRAWSGAQHSQVSPGASAHIRRDGSVEGALGAHLGNDKVVSRLLMEKVSDAERALGRLCLWHEWGDTHLALLILLLCTPPKFAYPVRTETPAAVFESQERVGGLVLATLRALANLDRDFTYQEVVYITNPLVLGGDGFSSILNFIRRHRARRTGCTARDTGVTVIPQGHAASTPSALDSNSLHWIRGCSAGLSRLSRTRLKRHWRIVKIQIQIQIQNILVTRQAVRGQSLYCPQDRGCGHVPNALRANRAYATRLARGTIRYERTPLLFCPTCT